MVSFTFLTGDANQQLSIETLLVLDDSKGTNLILRLLSAFILSMSVIVFLKSDNIYANGFFEFEVLTASFCRDITSESVFVTGLVFTSSICWINSSLFINL